MKPAPQENWENDRDWMLFQYVEGELTAEQAQNLEQKLATDAALQDELAAWQEAFVKEDDYETYALEATLLKPQTNFWHYFRTYSWLVLVLLVSPGLYRLQTPSSPGAGATEMETSTTTMPTSKSVSLSDISTQTYADVQRKKRPSSPEAASKNSIERKEKTPVDLGLVVQLDEEMPKGTVVSDTQNSLELTPGKPHTLPKKELPVPNKISRQQQRQIIRMKEKSRQQRQANEFMKGNEPYVVPLNSTNF